jgi:hypothetical protein
LEVVVIEEGKYIERTSNGERIKPTFDIHLLRNVSDNLRVREVEGAEVESA